MGDWPVPHGSDEWPYYSPLDQIRIWNSGFLETDWVVEIPGGAVDGITMRDRKLEVCAEGRVQRLEADSGLLDREHTAACPALRPASVLQGEGQLAPESMEAWGFSAWDEARCREQLEAVQWEPHLRVQRIRDPGHGTDYVATRRVPGELRSPLGFPCTRPPWTVLEAVDRETGDARWTVPLGSTRQWLPFPFWFDLGANLGSHPLLTGSGLLFVATGDRFLRVFNAHDGKQLWSKRLPGVPLAGPVTYRTQISQDQRIVLVVGLESGANAVIAISAPADSDARR